MPQHPSLLLRSQTIHPAGIHSAVLGSWTVDFGKLTAYQRKMDVYHQKHGDSIWALQYQTDVRTRNEHFVRLKREALADSNQKLQELVVIHGSERETKANIVHFFDPDRPWDSVFAALLKDKTWCWTNWKCQRSVAPDAQEAPPSRS